MNQFGGNDLGKVDYKKAPIVIQSIPFDGTSTWHKGADKGPEAILDASANMELYDIATDSEVYLRGIYTTPPLLVDDCTVDEMVDLVRQETRAHLQQDKFLVSLGGEHSVTIGVVQEYAKKYPGLTVLQLDAHTDLRPEYLGSKNNHACVMSRVAEVAPFVQVGIRSMEADERKFINEKRIFYAHEISGRTDWMDIAVRELDDPVYITIDLDVFDPSIMPATGTPEPGGLMYYEVLHFLQKVIAACNVVGFDVVELCPNPYSHASNFLASKLIYQLLSLKFEE